MKSRLDQRLVQLKLARSRSHAQDLIRRRLVKVNEQVVSKPSFKTNDFDQIRLLTDKFFVSRAAEKLLFALENFPIDVKDKICLDIGSSTGGFTQVLLQFDAKKIYAVDVGTNQLHPSLRKNPKVILMEQTDARSLSPLLIPEPIEIFVSDVSFISITAILPEIKQIFIPGAQGIVLIKPQFELTPQLVKKGVVRSPALHAQAIRKVWQKLSENGFYFQDLLPSPIKGADGNREFLAYIIYNNGVDRLSEQKIAQVVQQAHDS